MDDLATAANELRWYHTIELPGGVVTRGFYDTRRAVGRVPLPESLADMRCLDIASSDGFWAFEMERRELSVYDLSPEAVGEFDFVFIGNVLVHLRDPIGALQAAHTVTRGELF